MIILRDYNQEKKCDKVWYKSSNIAYSECDDKLNDFKTLKVVFKNGGTYEYQKVNVQDYLMFMHGGLDGSNGKALNKFIKNKYEVVKLENTDMEKLNNELQLLLEERKLQKQINEENGKDNGNNQDETNKEESK